MATNTYVPIATQTANGSVSTITFSSIPQTYTDLRLIITAGDSVNYGVYITYNNDGGSGSLYSFTRMLGNGSGAASVSVANRNTNTWVLGNGINIPTTPTDVAILDIMNYSNTTTYKTALETEANAAGGFVATVILWRNTAAISRIDLVNTGAFTSGSTFTLYGISAGPGLPWTPKATGGTITYGVDGYVYHTFTSSGTFTPTVNLTADYLVIAGGGAADSGGGGAGGLRSTVTATGGGGSLESPLSLTASTAYTVTVGAGGGSGGSDGGSSWSNGSNSVFGSITAIGGGKGGLQSNSGSYYSGGSGGGGGRNNSGYGAGTANQGYAGGTGYTSSNYGGGGGGGAGSVGGNGGTYYSGNGGAGVSIPAFASATGTGDNTYYASGGGAAGYDGGSGNPAGTAPRGGGGNGTGSSHGATAGAANTGGGGGGGINAKGDYSQGAAGGSGIVIVRYAK
jgi:hypothetical protein